MGPSLPSPQSLSSTLIPSRQGASASRLPHTRLVFVRMRYAEHEDVIWCNLGGKKAATHRPRAWPGWMHSEVWPYAWPSSQEIFLSRTRMDKVTGGVVRH